MSAGFSLNPCQFPRDRIRTLERLAAEQPARSSGWLPFRHVTCGGAPPAQFGQRRLSLRPPRLFVKCDVAVGIALIAQLLGLPPVGCPPRLVAGAATMAAVALRRAARINSAGVRVVAVAMAPTSSGPPALSASSASPKPVLETLAASTRPRSATYNRSAHRHEDASYAFPWKGFRNYRSPQCRVAGLAEPTRPSAT